MLVKKPLVIQPVICYIKKGLVWVVGFWKCAAGNTSWHDADEGAEQMNILDTTVFLSYLVGATSWTAVSHYKLLWTVRTAPGSRC